VSPPRALLLLAVALAACGRCGGGPEAAAGPKPVALVNGEAISPDMLRRELALGRAGGDGEAPTPVVRRRVLDDAVDRLLLLQEARAKGVTVAAEDVERARARTRADYPGTHFDDLLAQEKLSAAEVRAQLRERLTVERLLVAQALQQVSVTDADLRRHYDEHGAEFDEPARVRARQVVLRTREEAAKVRDELRRRPQSFPEVARRASIAPEGQNGGDLGFFGKGSGMPEVFDVCFRLPLNHVSEVTPSPYGFHVFQVTERRPAARRPFDEARAGIRERLLREARARAQEEYLAGLRRRATIQVDEKALASLAP
jgi:peptidyl-prolyl cis-trans isomerase C